MLMYIMETYALTLFSGQTQNRTGTDISNYSYYVNWAAIIPEKYRNNKFLINFSFHTDVTSNSASKTSVIQANGLNLISANFQGMSNVLGCVYLNMSRTGAIGTLGASVSDNNTIMGNYPNSNNLNIYIVDITNFVIAANGVAVLPNYMLTITFTPIVSNPTY
jgi:hypothetical protein